ncbi:hypothetical protein EVAR_7776_1 [Eumeta japonica]|uniref:Uncharacterized protein n=1 Tax=Eumeta variegata TaxID=151549 RepID=A0A4C1TM32_EUMVA|nr:hypothetical protein EVAR_7776_1 [Eumeta japonica]
MPAQGCHYTNNYSMLNNRNVAAYNIHPPAVEPSERRQCNDLAACWAIAPENMASCRSIETVYLKAGNPLSADIFVLYTPTTSLERERDREKEKEHYCKTCCKKIFESAVAVTYVISIPNALVFRRGFHPHTDNFRSATRLRANSVRRKRLDRYLYDVRNTENEHTWRDPFHPDVI